MKISIDGLDFEGTVEELADLFDLLNQNDEDEQYVRNTLPHRCVCIGLGAASCVEGCCVCHGAKVDLEDDDEELDLCCECDEPTSNYDDDGTPICFDCYEDYQFGDTICRCDSYGTCELHLVETVTQSVQMPVQAYSQMPKDDGLGYINNPGMQWYAYTAKAEYDDIYTACQHRYVFDMDKRNFECMDCTSVMD